MHFLLRILLFSSPRSLVFAEPLASFDGREATVASVHHALFTGLTTCRDVVSGFLARIEAFNRTINAIISLNPEALAIAETLDISLAAGNATAPLFCIPILLKDNYDMAGISTTCGCSALAQSVPASDAPSVTALKNAGAIILGKTNMHELALEGLSVSSLGGQTINPYDHTRTPGGSSGGTGAAIAASFAVFGTGTDTVNSLRSPASANSLFSFRPTRGLISRAGVVPISYTQDALGIIARCVEDLTISLTTMAGIGFDPADNTTALAPPSTVGIDYSAKLDNTDLSGMRFGLIEGFFNRTASPETTPVNDAMGQMVRKLISAGAVIIPIMEAIYNSTAMLAALDVQQYEYRELLSDYLSDPRIGGNHPRSMPELYSTPDYVVIPAQYSYVSNALISSTASTTYAARQYKIRNLTTALEATFKTNNLTALIYPEQKNLVVKIGSASQIGRNGILAAVTGSPVVTVPAGFSPTSSEAPIGVPIGMEILGLPWSEPTLLGIAKTIDNLKHSRRMPVFANGFVEAKAYQAVPHIVPQRGNIDLAAYPLGILTKEASRR